MPWGLGFWKERSMAVDRVVTCDVCHREIIRILPPENLEEEVVGVGGIPASLDPDGMDRCAKHTLADNRCIHAVRAYTSEADPAAVV